MHLFHRILNYINFGKLWLNQQKYSLSQFSMPYIMFIHGKCVSTIMLSPHGIGHCSSFEQTWISFIQEWFRQKLTETCSVEEDLLNFNIVFSLFHNYLPLEKKRTLHLTTMESTPRKDAACQVWLKLAQWIWGRRWKCGKFTDGRIDGRHMIRKCHLSFQLRWAKN